MMGNDDVDESDGQPPQTIDATPGDNKLTDIQIMVQEASFQATSDSEDDDNLKRLSMQSDRSNDAVVTQSMGFNEPIEEAMPEPQVPEMDPEPMHHQYQMDHASDYGPQQDIEEDTMNYHQYDDHHEMTNYTQEPGNLAHDEVSEERPEVESRDMMAETMKVISEVHEVMQKHDVQPSTGESDEDDIDHSNPVANNWLSMQQPNPQQHVTEAQDEIPNQIDEEPLMPPEMMMNYGSSSAPYPEEPEERGQVGEGFQDGETLMHQEREEEEREEEERKEEEREEEEREPDYGKGVEEEEPVMGQYHHGLRDSQGLNGDAYDGINMAYALPVQDDGDDSCLPANDLLQTEHENGLPSLQGYNNGVYHDEQEAEEQEAEEEMGLPSQDIGQEDNFMYDQSHLLQHGLSQQEQQQQQQHGGLPTPPPDSPSLLMQPDDQQQLDMQQQHHPDWMASPSKITTQPHEMETETGYSSMPPMMPPSLGNDYQMPQGNGGDIEPDEFL